MILRSDNRSPDQMRPVNITPDFISTAEGSCLIELGNTRVICTATIEDTVPQFLRNSGKGWVTGEYGMLPRSTLTRTPREVTKGRPAGRTHEIQRLIGRSLRAVTNMEALGERTILLDCDVIQADGGTRTASITGAFVAMGLAMRRMVESGALPVSPIRDYIAATSIGIVDGEIMLDLAYEEDARAEVDMNVVATGSKKLVEVQATAERRPFDDAQLAKMLALARQGIEALVLKQQAVLSGLPLRQ
ncbi:MAG TPA: ribonuclease PH [Terriglobales bacterium]|nr:ribonuclease PH [Terriglobales bacterium]